MIERKSHRAMIWMVILIATTATTATAAPEPGWEGIELETHRLEGAEHIRVHYEPAVAEYLAPAIEAIQGHRDTEAVQWRRVNRLRDGEVLLELAEIVGELPPAPARAMTDAMVNLFDALRMDRPERGAHIYLLDGEAVRAHLRVGETLPDMSHDLQTDGVTYEPEVAERARRGEPFSLAVPLNLTPDAATVPEQVTDQLQTVLDMLRDVAAIDHWVLKLSRSALASRLGSHARARWFVEGYAGAITLHLLREHYDAELADAFAQVHDTVEHDELADRINLRYWTASDLAIEAPIEAEQRIERARRHFAVQLAQRMVDTHGIGHIRAVLDEAPTGAPEALAAAFEQVIGEDLDAHLSRFEHFDTADDGAAHYAERFNGAMEAEDAEAALSALLRLDEIVGPGHVQRYSVAARLLERLEEPDAADAVFSTALALLEGHDEQQGVQTLRRAWIMHAIRHDRPEPVREQAEHVLAETPDDVPALLIRGHRQLTSGELDEAQETLERVWELTEPGSAFHSTAERLLRGVQQLRDGAAL